MKYLIPLFLILLAGCSSDDSTKLNEAKRDLRYTTEQLQGCQAQLSVYRDSSSSQSTYEAEQPAAPAEPEYEEVEYYEVDGTKCYQQSGIDNDGDVREACGITFYDCKDGVVRRCMTNIKYKVKQERRLVESEEE